MREYKRLAAAADFRNHPDGYLVMNIVNADGGDFGLHPRIDPVNGVLFLPSSDAPAYRVAVAGEDLDVLERFGKAILATVRSARGDASEDA